MRDRKGAGVPSGAFQWPVRVYYEDTDAGGVVYHANYLRFFERARTEWLRSLGFDQSRVRAEHGVVFAVRSMTLDFLKPARFDDQLHVGVFDTRAGRATLRMGQSIRREDGELLCQAEVRAACVDAHRFTPRSMPETIRAKIMGVAE